MCADGVQDGEDYRDWIQDHVDAMEGLFDYVAEPGKPPVTSLVKVFFHPRLDLVGLNYTPLAFNTLHHEFHGSWSKALCSCRGIVYNSRGELVALTLPKFFNDCEMPPGSVPETFNVALKKLDGELGIAYHYARKFRINTRGTFTYKTAKIAQQMLDVHIAEKQWTRVIGLKRVSLMFEVIHPETRKLVDYGDRQSLVLLAAFDLDTCEELDYSYLKALAERLGVEIAEAWAGNSVTELRQFVALSGIKNEEGYVGCFPGGLRVKFKFPEHLARMREAKLSYGEIMKRFVAGRHQEFILGLPEEIVADGQRMLETMLAVSGMADIRARRAHLYSLVVKEKLTSTYKGHCGKFLKAVATL